MFVIPNKEDGYLFGRGQLFSAYRLFGAHYRRYDKKEGVQCTVYAPRAKSVSVVGDFNDWQPGKDPLTACPDTGIYTGFIAGMQVYDRYKYALTAEDGRLLYKADPFAFYAEKRPHTASVVYDMTGYDWQDQAYMAARKDKDHFKDRPMNIYEIHLGSWDRNKEGDFLNYRQLASVLPDYLAAMHYTHVEFMPLMEHPYDGSWGYQITGFYAATSRYGPPQDLMALIDALHARGIGVIMDWVPVHFCKDEHGLSLFDGSPVFEYADPVRSNQANWGTKAFDLGKNQVISFLISNALFWLKLYHIDGLRVDAVASMVYLDFERGQDQWQKNVEGGRENLEGISFLKTLSENVERYQPDALLIAEESSAYAGVTAPVSAGGLGFDYKWNMGWMNDSLRYIKTESGERKYHHQLLTFSIWYAFTEHFILPISHDEVVHGKGSLLGKMPGDYWQKFANYRVYLAYGMTHPGKKLLFMGQEWGHFIEWDEKRPLDWFLLDYDAHRAAHHYVRALNTFYLAEPCLWAEDEASGGFDWIDADNDQQSVLSFIRYKKDDHLLILINFTPQTYEDYRIGVPQAGFYTEIFNSDEEDYGGSGVINRTSIMTQAQPLHHQDQQILLRLPPLAMVALRAVRRKEDEDEERG